MEPDDQNLNQLLREWKVPDAPRSLDERVLGSRGVPSEKPWWSFLLTGSIRIPVPVGIAIAAIVGVMAVALLRGRGPRPIPSPVPASTVSLLDFKPVSDMNVRVIEHHESN